MHDPESKERNFHWDSLNMKHDYRKRSVEPLSKALDMGLIRAGGLLTKSKDEGIQGIPNKLYPVCVAAVEEM